jgi:hypothetical protein
MTIRSPFSFACLAVAICVSARPVLAAAQETPGQPTPGAISGAVTDPSGAVVPGATVTLENASAGNRVSVSNGEGNFEFTALEPGTYKLTIAAKGFALWLSAKVVVHPGDNNVLPPVVLQIASASGNVDVALSPHEVAAEQLKSEEKQRLMGVFPNFNVTYIPNAAPLTTGQKFQLAWKTAIDPTSFAFAGAVAGYEQARDNLHAFGQGGLGYAKRYGVNYADVFSGAIIGTAILPSLFHQDPRYFYKGTGSILSRAFYAVANTVICKGDNGHWQPNYSSFVGPFAGAGLSNLYYPSHSQGTSLTISNTLLNYGSIAAGNLFEEFLSREITPTAVRKVPAGARLILHEGTAVSLILTEDLRSRSAEVGKSVAFSLAADVVVGRVIVARRGSKAFGEVADSGGSGNDGEAGGVEVQIKYLQLTQDRIPLRAARQRGGDTAVSFHVLHAKVGQARTVSAAEVPAGAAITVYVAGDVSLHPAQ